jgi:ribosomal protection tetracycline resistance protein
VKTLSLGILAHVDAGKTTLTERLLYAAGVIDEIGSVDDGNTQTDSLPLERQRGITIRSAVASFAIDELTVNLIDTPGHPDFIAEVERVLDVLDGTVLVISAVEGVQAQTRVLMRTLKRLRMPTLLFVNKIDRPGARYDGVLDEIRAKLATAIIPMGAVAGLGGGEASFSPAPDGPELRSRLIDVVAERDDGLLRAYVDDDPTLTLPRLRRALAVQSWRAEVHPVYFGSAITGAGVEALRTGIRRYLPSTDGVPDASPSGTVFKVERGPAGEKIAYVRMLAGTVRVRDSLRFGSGSEAKVTSIEVFERGRSTPARSVAAGQIGRLWGLHDVRIGDEIGTSPAAKRAQYFSPPTLEAVVTPLLDAERPALHSALTQLAEQDPLINLRTDDVRHELHVSLYGEVQKEVVEATLASDYGIDVDFHESRTLCIERPVRAGEAVELLQEDANPFRASIGLRIEPANHDSGIEFQLAVDPRTVPTHIYKNVAGFAGMMERYVSDTLRAGLFGWQVTDCTVTMFHCGYSIADGPPSTRGPDSTAADFRKLTPLVIMCALARARTHVCEPIHGFRLDVPADTLGSVLPALARLGATPGMPTIRGASYVIEGAVPAAMVHVLQHRSTELTGGEALLETEFDSYRPVLGSPPTRPRTDHNPLDRKQYLLHVLRRF